MSAQKNGFTLIELLLVVSIIGVLTGVMLSVINYRKHQNDAQDAVMRVNMEKLVTGLETYRTVEGTYPVAGTDGTPKDDPYVSTYIKGGWLNDEPPGAVYNYFLNSSHDAVGVTVNLHSGTTLKYTTAWSKIMECRNGAPANDDTCLTAGAP